MKPKFALDLSHEGINLLHRSKGGWSLVGSVALDDVNMGPHLAELRRRAAELESGGFTCKIIIPNSQILYTTVEAPGPDDIAREVQIRSGLDGVTPYPVGELVFDWRAAGERARVAVLARDTMDEAETFAVEHKFNPVSFVARPPQGEFSGEPFFGKTRAATKILGPTERVEPDASPVPRRPPAIEKAPPSGAVSAAVAAAAAALDENPFAEPSTGRRHAFPPQDLAPPPVPEPLDEPLPESPPAPVAPSADDPFAELDAIQAELSGDPSAAPPTFRSRADQGRARPASPALDTAAQHPAPPPLAPFPPTSDEEAGAKSSPPPARKPRDSGKPTAPSSQPPQARATPGPQTGATPSGAPKPASTPATGPSPAGKRSTPGRNFAPPAAPPARKPGSAPATAARIEGDTPVAPGVAFSTRRNGNGNAPVTTATPTAPPTAPPGESGSEETARQPESAAGSASAPPAPGKAAPESPARGARNDMLPSDRRRADMADALARPLPGTPGAKPQAPAGPADSGPRGALSGAMRGAASGLRSFGQRRTARKADSAQPRQSAADQPASAQRGAAPGEPRSSMAELMRGAGSSAARISPDQRADEPNLLAPDIADTGPPRSDTAAPAKAPTPSATPAKPPAAKPATPSTLPKPAARAPAAAPTPAAEVPSDAAPAKPAGSPAAARIDSRKVQAQPKKPATEPKPAEKPDGINVFGARGIPEQGEGRKYLGLILTLLLILGMALIAFWSNLFIDTSKPPLFNPGDTPSVAPEAEPADVGPAAPVPPAADPAPAETGDTPPVDGVPDAAPDATAPNVPPTPRVLTPEEAEARYAESQIWQRAPETMAEPRTPGLDFGDVGGPGALRGEPSDTGLDNTGLDDTPAVSSPAGSAPDRADPLPPPPADTLFELDANGLVAPSPGGTVSPTGIVVFEGPPAIIPPERPFTPEPEAAAPEAVPDTPVLEAAVDPAAADQPFALPDTPDLRPAPRPEDLPTGLLPVPDAAAPDAADPDAPLPGDANLDPEGAGTDTAVVTESTAPADAAALTAAEPPQPPSRPGDLVVPTAASAADAAAIEAAVDSATADLVDATELAVAASIKPSHRPADFDSIVSAATARAAAAPPPPAAAPATTTPSIPTSASVADQATTSNAINLREINLLGISGPSNARRALVRMANGRYVTVKVGDRLDGGRVTSITDTGLTYQKGSRNLALQLLPLG